ncbi:UNVERIFIED_CONTAM: hypothetical protein K2H54_047725 [Gekko kuhli]
MCKPNTLPGVKGFNHCTAFPGEGRRGDWCQSPPQILPHHPASTAPLLCCSQGKTAWVSAQLWCHQHLVSLDLLEDVQKYLQF